MKRNILLIVVLATMTTACQKQEPAYRGAIPVNEDTVWLFGGTLYKKQFFGQLTDLSYLCKNIF